MSPHDSKTATTNEHERQSGRQPENKQRFGVSLTQVVGSALAAAAAAFGASFLGVAGTIIGAAVASVIATVASAMYTTSLTRTRAVVSSTVTQWTRTSQTAPVVDPSAPRPRVAEPSRRTRTPWSRVAVAAAAALVVALGGLTAVEAVVGKPLATLLGGSQAQGTSLGAVSGGGGSGTKTRSTPSRTPAPTTTPTPAPSATPSVTPDPTPSVTPSGTPTGTPGATPSADPTATPTPAGPLVTLP